jgi:Xaa-Pro aminopeptidase
MSVPQAPSINLADPGGDARSWAAEQRDALRAAVAERGWVRVGGLGVRDAGEVLKGRPAREDEFPKLRVDLPLLPGYVMTVEPGIYFVPALMDDAELRERHRDAVDWDRAEAMLGFGGIRIEHNVLITDEGNEVLTADVPLVV